MKKVFLLLPLAVAIIMASISCKKTETTAPAPTVPDPDLTISQDSLKFAIAGGSDTLTIAMNGSRWAAASDQSWCTLSDNSSTAASSRITVTVTANPNMGERTAKLTFAMDSKTVVNVKVIQAGRTTLYPKYGDSIAPDASGMSSTAVQLAAKIKLGWNIGNTMEAPGGETAWGNPAITESYIKFVKQNGFTAIRIPCAWDLHVDNEATAHIDTNWLKRVKEVVGYCVDNDMYVLLNIHWDGGWLEQNCTTAKKDSVNAKQKAFWEQIATEMRDFDEHLMFASANEPDASDATQMSVLLSYHQTFINAVRSTGGHNSYRVLVVQGPKTDIETTNTLMNTLPADPTPNRMMVEIHYYTPWNFCGMTQNESWGNMFYYWGNGFHSTTDPAHNANWGEESDVDKYMAMMKTKFVDKGIPVVMGEYGPIRRTNLTGDALTLHLASRAYYLKYVTQAAKLNGILPFFWDTGSILSRSENSVLDQQSLDALLQGGQ